MKEFLFSIPVTSLGDGEKFYYAVLANVLADPEQKSVKRIDTDGLDHSVTSLLEVYTKSSLETIKIEGIEEFSEVSEGIKIIENHMGTLIEPYEWVSAHMFRAAQRAASFPTHTDPVDLVIWCIHGIKVMEVNGTKYQINQNECLFIPANAPHRALNDTESIMLSVGFEKS